MCYYDDFYEEPSEFDTMVEEFKESLMKSVKEDYVEKMEKLEKENQALRVVKKDFSKIKEDFEKKKYEYEKAICEANQNAKKARIEELLNTYKLILYSPNWGYCYTEKCSKCDEHRNIEVKLPSGRKIKDACKCGKEYKRFYPEKMLLYEIENCKNSLRFYYVQGNESDGYVNLKTGLSSYANENLIKPGTKFEDLEEKPARGLLFSTYEECVAYCDYINKKNGVPDDAVYKLNGDVYEDCEGE